MPDRIFRRTGGDLGNLASRSRLGRAQRGLGGGESYRRGRPTGPRRRALKLEAAPRATTAATTRAQININKDMLDLAELDKEQNVRGEMERDQERFRVPT